MAGTMKYRLRASALSESHVVAYANAIKTSKELNDNRGYYHFSGLHGAPGRWCWHHQFSRHSSLTARIFLPWHRAYLHRFEQSLQDIDENVAIPFWDWAKGSGIPQAFSEQSFDGDKNPLLNSHITLNPPQVQDPINRLTSRNPDSGLPIFSFPDADVNNDGRATLEEIVDYIVVNVTRFEDFNDILESIHDSIHGYVGGDMASVTTSAYDPIFYSHHCMIDRIWALWQEEHGVDNYPSGLHSVVLEPFGLTVKDVLNLEELGYEYADSVSVLNPA